MFSVPDILVISVLALLLFGPDRLPKMMRQAGRLMREVQNTSQSFVAEMERAADVSEPTHPYPTGPASAAPSEPAPAPASEQTAAPSEPVLAHESAAPERTVIPNPPVDAKDA
jgi:TatA/E family protein of Tat protein translocase